MSGCLSERYRDELQKELPEVDLFTGVGDYHKIDELIANKSSDDVFLIEDEDRIVSGSSFHAYIKIAEGCNQSCSFCAIPSFKGKLHSRGLESIIKEVKLLVKKGFKEFSFISQDSSSYLLDMGIKDGLIKLIESVEKIEGVKKARILYLYPSTTSFELIDKIGESDIFGTYYDIPLQHISSKILKKMKRGVGQKKHIALLDRMKSKEDAFIRTTFILGHPGEDEDDFNELKKFVEDFGFDRVNLFEYSPEEGTSAYKMRDKVDKTTISKRIKSLNKVVEKSTKKSLEKLINKEMEALLLGVSDEHEYFYEARPLIFAPDIDGTILINDSEVKNIEFEQLYKILITEVIGSKAIGKIIYKC